MPETDRLHLPPVAATNLGIGREFMVYQGRQDLKTLGLLRITYSDYLAPASSTHTGWNIDGRWVNPISICSMCALGAGI